MASPVKLSSFREPISDQLSTFSYLISRIESSSQTLYSTEKKKKTRAQRFDEKIIKSAKRLSDLTYQINEELRSMYNLYPTLEEQVTISNLLHRIEDFRINRWSYFLGLTTDKEELVKETTRAKVSTLLVLSHQIKSILEKLEREFVSAQTSEEEKVSLKPKVDKETTPPAEVSDLTEEQVKVQPLESVNVEAVKEAQAKEEVTDVLSVESKTTDLSQDTWVRITFGRYKGDLAKVINVDNVRQKATVKLIPRIHLHALANWEAGKQAKKKKKKPPPRLLNVDEALEMNIHVERRSDLINRDFFAYIDGMLFKDGFLYKTVSIKSISTHSIQPSYDDLVKFHESTKQIYFSDLTEEQLMEKFCNRPMFQFELRVVLVKWLQNFDIQHKLFGFIQVENNGYDRVSREGWGYERYPKYPYAFSKSFSLPVDLRHTDTVYLDDLHCSFPAFNSVRIHSELYFSIDEVDDDHHNKVERDDEDDINLNLRYLFANGDDVEKDDDHQDDVESVDDDGGEILTSDDSKDDVERDDDDDGEILTSDDGKDDVERDDDDDILLNLRNIYDDGKDDMGKAGDYDLFWGFFDRLDDLENDVERDDDDVEKAGDNDLFRNSFESFNNRNDDLEKDDDDDVILEIADSKDDLDDDLYFTDAILRLGGLYLDVKKDNRRMFSGSKEKKETNFIRDSNIIKANNNNEKRGPVVVINFSEFAKTPSGGSGYHISYGSAARLELYYVALKYRVVASLEVEFDETTEKTKVSGTITTAYGRNFDYSSNPNIEHLYTIDVFKAKDYLVEPGKINLKQCELSVPAKCSLTIYVSFIDSTAMVPIMNEFYDFHVPLDLSRSVASLVGNGFSLKLKVDWRLPLNMM